MFIFILVALVLIVAFYFLFPWRWSPYNPTWTIQSNEEIQNITFNVKEEDNSDTATSVVYLKSNSSNKKLSSDDSIAVNGQPMKSEYYNNGTAVGYKYILELKKATQYTLLIQRQGKPEITKVTTANYAEIRENALEAVRLKYETKHPAVIETPPPTLVNGVWTVDVVDISPEFTPARITEFRVTMDAKTGAVIKITPK